MLLEGNQFTSKYDQMWSKVLFPVSPVQKQSLVRQRWGEIRKWIQMVNKEFLSISLKFGSLFKSKIMNANRTCLIHCFYTSTVKMCP